MKDESEAKPGSIPAVEGGGLCVLVNPGSGTGHQAESMNDVRAAFSTLGVEAEVRRIETNPYEAARRAVDEGFGTIVAMGGDGTVGGVAAALVGTDARLGVLPGGTFNFFARSLGIPDDLRAAARVIVEGDVRPVRVGRAGGRIFLNNASIGAYAEVLAQREQTYRTWGRSRWAAYWAAIRALLSWRRPLKVTIETPEWRRTLRTPILFAINNSYQLREMGLEGEDLLAAGQLAVFVSPDVGRWGMVSRAIRLALGFATKHRDFELFGAREMNLTVSRRRTLLAVDGERSRVRSPIHVAVQSVAIQVLAPKRGGGR